MPETGRITGHAGAVEQAGYVLDISLRHLLLDAIGAKAGDRTGDKDLGLVKRVAKVVTGLAADYQGAGLAHERAHMSDRTADDNRDPLHRDAAARPRVALDDDEPAATRGGSGLRGVAAHPDDPAHDVLGEPGPGMAVHGDRGRRVHAGAIVSDMPVYLDLHRLGEADRNRMRAIRVQHPPMTFVGPRSEPVQSLVQFAHRTPRQIDFDHWRCQE